MKNYFIKLLAITTIIVIQFMGCSMDQEEKVEAAKVNVDNIDQDLKEAQAEYEKEWQLFKNEIQLKLGANEKSINEFKTEMLTASGKFKLKYENEINLLEKKNIELKKKLFEYKYAGKDQWKEFKQEVSSDLNIVDKALKDIFTKKE